MKKSYIITKDVKSPVVMGGGTAHKPAQIRYKTFRKGNIVQGELKHADNKPAFVLVGRMMVIPIDCVKELQGKDIQSEFSGADMDKRKTPETIKANPKVLYMDALIVGAIVGYLAVHIAEKKGYIPNEEGSKQNKLYGAIGGALVGMYIIFRNQNNKPSIKK